MTNADFLDRYLQMQYKINFDELTKVSFAEATITFCESDDSNMWNFALVKEVLSEQQLSHLEEEFNRLQRVPSIYFENMPSLFSLKELLVRRGYKISYEDSWMFYEKETIDLSEDYKVLGVSNDQELNTFLEVFRNCYQKDDPQNPYGDLGEDYLKTVADSWYRYHQTQRVECFIFYKDKEPVAISELTSYKDSGYISNVGSIRNVRGAGFGKLATLHCVKRSMQKGYKYHFLATEEGHYPYEFYQRIGFKKKFTAIDYVKE